MNVHRSRSVFRWIVVAAIVVAGGALAMGAVYLNRPRVTVTRVVEASVVDAFYATGTVQPATEYPIKTSNAGIIAQLWVDKGDAVVVGQKLARVEDPDIQFKFDKATADLKQAEERAEENASPVLKEYDAKLAANAVMVDNSQHELARLNDMSGKGGASKTDVEKAADHVQDMRSLGQSLAAQRQASRLELIDELETARAALKAARTNLDLQTLISPINGVVLDRPAPLGTRLAVNQNDHVMQLADVQAGNLRMRAAVDEENVAEVSEGQLVQMVLYSFPKRPFEGHVTRRYPKADADRRTFEVDVAFDAPDAKLATGMTGELAFIVSHKDRALVAPAQAYQGEGLFTVRGGRLVKLDDARIGIRGVERVEIVQGLSVGDPVVITPVLDLAPGALVRTTYMDPAAAAGLNKSPTALQKNPLSDH